MSVVVAMNDKYYKISLVVAAILFIWFIYYISDLGAVFYGDQEINRHIIHAAYAGTQDEYISAKIAYSYEQKLGSILGPKGWPGLTFGNLKNCYANDQITLDSAANRKRLANMYLKGSGIEVGIAHIKVNVPDSVQIKYVNSLSLSEQRKVFTKHSHAHLHDNNTEPDVIDKIHLLSKFTTNSQDFLIANHVLEHTQHVILAIYNYIRVLKPGGEICILWFCCVLHVWLLLVLANIPQLALFWAGKAC